MKQSYINSLLRRNKDHGAFTAEASWKLTREDPDTMLEIDFLRMLLAENWCEERCLARWSSGLEGRHFTFHFERAGDAARFERDHHVER